MTVVETINTNNNADIGNSKRPVTKEKLRSIMEAASALTALGDEESDNSRPSSPVNESGPKNEQKKEQESVPVQQMKESPKRYLPDHKKPDAAPTFPEKLMSLMQYADQQEKDFCVSWLEDGKSFVIRNPDAFTRNVVPKFFKPTKFSSFTRKLYRWGFRQVNRGIGPDDPIIFGNEFFQRDNAELMAKMRSITAAGTRKAEQHRAAMFGGGMKRPLEQTLQDDTPHKRFLFDHLMHQQQKANIMCQSNSLYGAMSAGGNLSLNNALCPPQRPTIDMTMNMMPSAMEMRQQGGMGSAVEHMGGLMPPRQAGMEHRVQQGNHGMMAPMVGYDSLSKACDYQQHPAGFHAGTPNVNNVNSLMSQYVPQGANIQSSSQQQQYPSAASTAEIVNAAIAALRYAN